jgi:hypothetical protein
MLPGTRQETNRATSLVVGGFRSLYGIGPRLSHCWFREIPKLVCQTALLDGGRHSFGHLDRRLVLSPIARWPRRSFCPIRNFGFPMDGRSRILGASVAATMADGCHHRAALRSEAGLPEPQVLERPKDREDENVNSWQRGPQLFRPALRWGNGVPFV